jgi:hypothetical protein
MALLRDANVFSEIVHVHVKKKNYADLKNVNPFVMKSSPQKLKFKN